MLDLKQNPTVYITRDIERALGLEIDTSSYYIISNYSDFAKQWTNSKDNALLVNEQEQLDTWQLLQNEKVVEFLNKLNKPNILVFKNTLQIERICKEKNWNLLNPSAKLSNKIEEKISQVEWLGELKKYLPSTEVKICKDVKFENKKFILQFNRAHTGLGTILIESQEQLDEIKNKFPEREVRISEFIKGPVFTSNNVVAKNKILIGNISYQITGLPPFTDQPFAAIGNDWGVVKNISNQEQIEQFKTITTEIGERMQADGWKGLFGVDIVLEEKTGELYLIEINARQPASTSYESQLQKTNTVFEAHLATLLDLPAGELTIIDGGSQIILRNSEQIKNKNYKLPENFNVIKYNNTKPGSDLLRIQSKVPIMKKHNEFNKNGLSIIKNIIV